MKYIIKNCPAMLVSKNIYYCTDLYNLDEKEQFCEDKRDCLLKQIAERCKARSEKFFSFLFAQEILNLLEIEEMDE